jgi:cytoskeletal protein RodZ
MESHVTGTSALPHRNCVLELDLPRFRKRAGVSLEEIVQRTKISSRFLRAIEDEQFDQLPGGIFSTSYLRQYAAAIGYDEDALVAFYVQKVNPSAALAKPPQRETGSRKLLDRWLGTAAQAPR